MIRESELKVLGNAEFSKRQYTNAIHYYTQAIEICQQPSRVQHDRLMSAALYSNRSLCYIELKRFNEALSDAILSLKIDPKNEKSLYRSLCSLTSHVFGWRSRSQETGW
jgi:tetratricopeptide (TPR) repeat protein